MPGNLQIVKAIYPTKRELVNVDVLDREVLGYFRKHGNLIKKELRKPVRSWKHKITWRSRQITTNRDITLEIYPTGSAEAVEIFGYVNEGVAARIIKPNNPSGRLKFQRNFRSATRPNTLYGGTYKKFGQFSSPKAVRWPGIKPRNFYETVMKANGYPRAWTKDMTKAVNDSIKACRDQDKVSAAAVAAASK